MGSFGHVPPRPVLIVHTIEPIKHLNASNALIVLIPRPPNYCTCDALSALTPHFPTADSSL